MKDIVIKSVSRYPLRWNLAELDAVMNALPDHGSLVFVIPLTAEFDAFWSVLVHVVASNAHSDGLFVKALDGNTNDLRLLEKHLTREALDIVFVRCRELRSIDEASEVVSRVPVGAVLLCRRLPSEWQDTFDVAVVFENGTAEIKTPNRKKDFTGPFQMRNVIAFAQSLGSHESLAREISMNSQETSNSPHSKNFAEASISDAETEESQWPNDETEESQWPDAETEESQWPDEEPSTQVTSKKSEPRKIEPRKNELKKNELKKDAPRPQDLISKQSQSFHADDRIFSSVDSVSEVGKLALIGVAADLAHLLKKHLGTKNIDCTFFEYSKVRRQGESPADKHQWVVFAGAFSDAGERAFIEKNASLSHFILLATKHMRSSDCAIAYQMGVRLVLTVDSEIEERFAAICAQLLPRVEKGLDPFQEVDLEYARLVQRFRRRLIWEISDTAQAVVHFFPLLANQMQRASLAGQSVGALLIDLPQEIPSAAGFQSLRALVQRSVIGSLFQSLRQRDLTFVIGDTLVVLSHQMNAFTARAILRRLTLVLKDLGIIEIPRARILRAVMPDQESATEEAKKFLRKVCSSENLKRN